jgi:radical SAM protein with 4Fe4S-binding SPASM domain
MQTTTLLDSKEATSTRQNKATSYMKILQTIFAYKFKRSYTHPFRLIVNITGACQSLCKTCDWGRDYLSRKYSVAGELTLDDYDRLFTSIRDIGWLSLGGGEPTMRKDLPDIAIAASRRCRTLLGVDFSTNGLTPKIPARMAEKIAKNTELVAEIAISLDGPPELHDYIRGQKGNWEKCIETYNLLKGVANIYPNIGVHFNYTMSGFNTGHMPEFFKSLKDAGLAVGSEDISVSFAHVGSAFANIGNDGFMITDREKAAQDLAYFVSQYSITNGANPFQLWRRTTKKIFLNLAKDKYLKSPGSLIIPCAALHASCFMDARGNIYPCTIWPEKIGNVKEAGFDFDKVWKSPKAKEVRNRIREEKCVCRSWSGCDSTQSIMVGMPTVLKYAI